MNSKSSYPCPKCGENLDIDNDYINLIDEIDITCPSCNNKFKGKALLEKHSDENNIQEKTILVKGPGANKKEKVGLFIKENFIDENGTPGGTNQFYEIKNDVTVVGRKSDSSKADIQIPSNRYMSRQHVVITKSNGRYTLKWATPTNPPLVNGVKVSENESIVLKGGDVITLGQCVIEWKHKPLDENRSILL